MYETRDGTAERPSLLRRGLALLVLIAAVAIGLKIVIGLVMTVLWVALGVIALVAVLWAMNTILG